MHTPHETLIEVAYIDLVDSGQRAGRSGRGPMEERMRNGVVKTEAGKLEEGAAVTVFAGSNGGRRRFFPRAHPVRTLVLAVVLVLVIAALWSYVGALTAPGSAGVGAKTVEWISNDVPGGRAVVLFAERMWYTWTAPPAGGTPPAGLPLVSTTPPTGQPAQPSDPESAGRLAQSSSSAPADQSVQPSTTVPVVRPAQTSGSPLVVEPPPAASATQVPVHLGAPPSIVPIAANRLPGEGQWQVAGRLVAGLPAIRVAYLRPDPIHTTLVTGVMWLDMKLLRAELVPGTQLPASSNSWSGLHFSIPARARADLMATFNSGFLLRDSGGGWYGQGVMAAPLQDGEASLVISRDGTATVGRWGRDATMNSNIAAVRQNLQLIVDQGQVNPTLATDDYKIWGGTLGNTVMTWRSGVGVTEDGALVYAAGDKLTVQSLADVLQRAGAVRAMELDINRKWTSANYYELAPGDSRVASPTKLLPNMTRPATRYFVPDERDFVAVFLRSDLLHAT